MLGCGLSDLTERGGARRYHRCPNIFNICRKEFIVGNLRHWREAPLHFLFLSLFLTFRHVDQELGEAPILPGPRAIRRRHQSRKVARRLVGVGGAPSAPRYGCLGRGRGVTTTAGASGRRGRDAGPKERRRAQHELMS